MDTYLCDIMLDRQVEFYLIVLLKRAIDDMQHENRFLFYECPLCSNSLKLCTN